LALFFATFASLRKRSQAITHKAMDLVGRRVAIVGAAATGRAAGPVLARRGARVIVYDAKADGELGDAPRVLRAAGAELRLGDRECRGIEEAELIVPSPGVPAEAPFLQAARARGVPVLAEIEVAAAISAAPIIAVTGTNGKTTTVMMAAAALRAARREVIVGGNALAGGYQVPLIAAADQAPARAWIVAEVSSFQLEWTSRFRPRVAVITNVTPDHMNRHGTMAAYVAAKARLLAAQTPDDFTILNADNPATASLAAQARGRLLLFSRLRKELPAGGWVEERGGERWLTARLEHAPVTICRAGDLRVPGEHTVENALAAALAALAAGAPAERVGAGLTEFRGVADRLEYIASVRGVEYVNNTMCTNVDAAVRSLEAYSQPILLIAGGKDKGSDFTPLGRAILRKVKRLIAIGDDGGRIEAAARAAGFTASERAGSMEEAVRRAAAHAAPGDVVLLAPACASFDWYGSFEERGAAFKAAVRRLEGEG
jgi:UDP-N-acetylmuramoylalanine--D-glutamate ligase